MHEGVFGIRFLICVHVMCIHAFMTHVKRVKFYPIPKHTYVHAPVTSEADTRIEFRVGGASLANVV